jgi:hypothetical protein
MSLEYGKENRAVLRFSQGAEALVTHSDAESLKKPDKRILKAAGYSN